MIRTGTLEAGGGTRRHQRLANGAGYWRTDLIAAAPSEGWAPQAFLVEQDPRSVILPHFHQRDEFQVVVRGEGTFGRHAVGPVTVHYAGRHTGYGPITSGEEGLWYFSLRAVADPGAQFLPESRDRIDRRIPKRHWLAEPVSPSTCNPGIHEVIAAQPDGLAAWLLRAPAGSRLELPDPGRGARFHIVAAGELRWRGERLPRFAAVFTPAEDREFFIEAGAEDAAVLALRFPFDTPRAQ